MAKKGEKFSNRKGQIWVETIMYTLIVLALIGLVLAFAVPQIQNFQDKAVIEQSINIMQAIDNNIISVVQGGTGNKRTLEINLRKGEIKIDPENDSLIFEMETEYDFSEVGKGITFGNIIALTQETGSAKKVTLTSSYDYDLTYQGTENEKVITQGTTPYKFSIENKGSSGGNITVDISVS